MRIPRPAHSPRAEPQLSPSRAVQLHTLGGVAPEQVPLWVNAANAVVVPSEAEGFGLAVLEALACDVPVLATPVGVHPQALEGVAGTLCAPFDVERWRAAVAPTSTPPTPGSRAEPTPSRTPRHGWRRAWRRRGGSCSSGAPRESDSPRWVG